MRAAAAVGPNARMPSAASASTRPATSGASGPTTTRSASLARGARPRRPSGQAGHAVAGDAGVAGGQSTSGAGGCAERAHERVLAPARPDDEDTATRYSAAMNSSIGIAVSVS